MKSNNRMSGILLHPSSLPGPYGIGDFGPEAFKFIDFLFDSGASLWQVLPLNPPGFGDSPYSALSTHAGNPLLISLDLLVESGELNASELLAPPDFPNDRVHFGRVAEWKMPLLTKAAHTFVSGPRTARRKSYELFCKKETWWLEDYCLFASLKAYYDQKAVDDQVHSYTWANYWDEEIRHRTKEGLRVWREKLREQIQTQRILQFFFFSQWGHLKAYANRKGIRIIGDVPIYVAFDSVDVWANRKEFQLTEKGHPIVVSGVPPDYFSKNGQRWGNPIYNWPHMKKNRFKWWVTRIQSAQKLYDLVRFDHFRGFDSYWEIPASEKTAVKGHWRKGPGHSFIRTIIKKCPKVEILAEDLGELTKAVETLRDDFNLPGMRIIQFAFDAIQNGKLIDTPNLPFNFPRNSVAYTGTHDNTTSAGWVSEAKPDAVQVACDYLNCTPEEIPQEFIRTCYSSAARIVIIPLQDHLFLGAEHRMNVPSNALGNWSWRLSREVDLVALAKKILKFNVLYSRQVVRS